MTPRLEPLETRDCPSGATLLMAEQIVEYGASNTHRTGRDVAAEYLRALGRGPNLAEAVRFTGAEPEVILTAVFQSGEYHRRFATPDAYTRSLYAVVLHREASVAEVVGWDGQPPDAVAAAVVFSVEGRRAHAERNAEDWLGRHLSMPELLQWDTVPWQEQDVQFLGSDEYAAPYLTLPVSVPQQYQALSNAMDAVYNDLWEPWIYYLVP
jgi:hypothetical protein